MSLKLFVRQPFTESAEREFGVVQAVLEVMSSFRDLEFLTGTKAYSEATFRLGFESETGQSFNPKSFRRHRLSLIDQADAMVVIRAGLSESGAFEVAYNIFSGRKAPVFFAIWKQSPIRTTLLRELDDICSVQYQEFDDPKELLEPLNSFFQAIQERGA